jgi:hypothetical protein
LEYYLFGAASDLPLSRDEFYRCGGRSIPLSGCWRFAIGAATAPLTRALIPYLSFPARSVNPYIGQPVELDAARYRALMDEYYALRGWDVAHRSSFPRDAAQPGHDRIHE